MTSNNLKKSISIMLTLLLTLIVTSCSTIIRKTTVEEIGNPVITENEKNQVEPKGIVVDGELRYYDGELFDITKRLIEKGLITREIQVFFNFPVDLNDTIVANSEVVYSKVLDNRYGIKSLKDVEEFFSSVYSNEDTIHKMSYRNGEPLFVERDGQLYASSDGSSGTVGYSIQDWHSIYLTDISETTAVVSYPLFYYWGGIDNAAIIYKNTIAKVDGKWLLENVLDEEPVKLDEKTSEKLGIRSIFLNDFGRFIMYDFIKHEGETIERDGSKYTNIGYIISPENTFISYEYNNLESFIDCANDETLEIINNYFIEIDGKIYVKNIEELRKEYTRDYKYETLEVLSVNDKEASLKINYLDFENNEKTLNFKMYSDPERSWIWDCDAIL